MEPTSPIPRDWLTIAYLLLATLLGGGLVGLFNAFINRKKPAVEIHKTLAETIHLEVETDTKKFDLVDRMFLKVEEAQETIDRLRGERNEFKQRCETQESELKLNEYQIKRMDAFIKLHGLSLSELDQHTHHAD